MRLWIVDAPPAALAAHHQRGLAGERRVFHLAVDMRREMPRERGLAGAGIAEQTKQLRRPAPRPVCR
jgi:hypothetical protein